MRLSKQIIEFAAENWDVGRRQTENYIKEAERYRAKDCEITRQAYLAEVLARLRNYEARRGLRKA